MDTTLSETREINLTTQAEIIDGYCDKGLYLDALHEGQVLWGELQSWQGKEKQLIAIRIMNELGSSRQADALLLRLWRNNKSDVKVLSQIYLYKFCTLGPILTKEWLVSIKDSFQQNDEDKALFYAMQSTLNREMKNVALSESQLNLATALDPTNTWFIRLQIRLLITQDNLNDAKQLSAKHYNETPSINYLKLHSFVLEESEDFNASLSFISQEITRYQSASLLLRLAQMQSIAKDFSACETTISQYLATYIGSDKHDQRILTGIQGEIAIHNGDYDLASELLSEHQNYYCKTIAKNIKKSGGIKNSKSLNFPFLRQTHLTCAPTTLAAISQYWGFNHSSAEIAEQICFNGTPDTLQRTWLRNNGFHFIEFELNAQLAYSLIDRGVPFTLVTTSGYDSHLQAVFGYDQQLGTLFIMDPSSSIKQEVLAQELIDDELYSGAHCYAIVPQEKAELLDDLMFPAKELFIILDQFQNAHDIRDFDVAQHYLDAMVELSPNHRITLQTKRIVAIENDNATEMYDLNLQLLTRFPNETLLHSSLYFCGKELGTQEDSLNKLALHLENHLDRDLLITYFTEIYKNTNQRQEIENTVYKLKRQAYYSDRAIYALANYYWSIQDHLTATEYYLIAHCMDDTNNRYVESYFKAARYLDQQDEALTTLKLRYEKYKTRSVSPAISLYHALALLDLETEGLTYLYDALKLHPDDKALIDFIAHKLINLQQFDKLDSIQSIIEASLSEDDFNEVIARKHAKQGQIDEALVFYQSMYKQSPFTSRFANNYFSLLERANNQEQADRELDSLYKNNKTNTQVLDYIIDWHGDDQVKIDAFKTMLKVRPNYSEVRRQYIDLLARLGKHQEALKIAEETCKIITGELDNTAYLANCYLSNGLIHQAKQTARQVLSVNVDNRLAFDTLVSACTDDIETLNALEFVLAKIKSQVIFGDAAWNFWFRSKAFASDEMLNEFINYIMKHNSHQWSTYSIASMYYLQLNDTNQATDILLNGIKKFPLISRLYWDKASIHEALGQSDKAIEQYKIALQHEPSSPDIAKQLADALQGNSQFNEASAVIKKSLKYNNSEGTLHGYLAEIHIQQHNEEAALESLSRAVEQFSDYLWAWDKIIEIASSLNAKDKLDTHNYAVELATSFTKKTPHLAQSWFSLSYVTKHKDEKLKYLEQALKCNERYLPAHREKVMLSMQVGDYKTAEKLIMTTPWKDNLPMALIPIKFDILELSGQDNQAISYLKTILSKTTGYSHLWRRLYRLLEKNKNTAEIVLCSQIQAKLNPHDPEVISQVGDNLIKYGNQEKEKIGDDYLFKAYQLAGNDENVAINYIDRLINKNQFGQALRVIITLERFTTSSFVIARKIHVLSERQQYDEAISLLKPMLSLRDKSYWVVSTAFDALSGHFSKDQLLNVFSGQLKELNEVQIYFWAEQQCEYKKKAGVKKVISALDIVEKPASWSTLFNALFDYWEEHNLTPPEKLITKYKTKLESDPSLVAKLNYTYLEKQKYYNLIHSFERVKDKDLLPAYSFHHYVYSLQMAGLWDKTLVPLEQGLTLNADHSLDVLKLWQVFERFRTMNTIDPVDLDMINQQELGATDQYVHTLLTAMIKLGTANLEDKKNELSPLLRTCQRFYQQTIGVHQANFAKKTVRAHLKQSISSDKFLDRMKLKWWIHNHF